MAKKENIDIDESELLGFMSAGQQQYKSATVDEPANESEDASESKKLQKRLQKRTFYRSMKSSLLSGPVRIDVKHISTGKHTH